MFLHPVIICNDHYSIPTLNKIINENCKIDRKGITQDRKKKEMKKKVVLRLRYFCL